MFNLKTFLQGDQVFHSPFPTSSLSGFPPHPDSVVHDGLKTMKQTADLHSNWRGKGINRRLPAAAVHSGGGNKIQ